METWRELILTVCLTSIFWLFVITVLCRYIRTQIRKIQEEIERHTL